MSKSIMGIFLSTLLPFIIPSMCVSLCFILTPSACCVSLCYILTPSACCVSLCYILLSTMQAIIWAIAGVDNLSLSKAEEKYLNGRCISER